MSQQRLSDLGERRIVTELLAPRYASSTRHFGDDAATVPSPRGELLVVTTDPCPPPMALTLGLDDLFYAGWLLATINLSDLAAAGADPVGMVTSLMLPRDTSVAAFERLLDGIDGCCKAQGTAVLGGNLKEYGSIELSATAIGQCDGQPLTRSGAKPGDCVVILGDLGRFWAGTLAVRAGLLELNPSEALLRTVVTPEPQVRAGAAARRAGLLTSCMDNSDGLPPSLRQLAAASGVRFVLDGDRIAFDDDVRAMAEQLNADPLRLALGWGDWQLVATCPVDQVDELSQCVSAAGSCAQVVGDVVPGSGVGLCYRGAQGELLPLESERFAADSWFTAGIESYVETLLTAPLVVT